MTSNQQKAKQSSRWGSLLSGAVSGLESRLDTILGEEADASAKSRAVEKALLEAKAAAKTQEDSGLSAPVSNVSRSSSRSRVNDRLQERLAKAVVNRSSSQTPSEGRSSGVPTQAQSTRTSLGSRPSGDAVRPTIDKEQQGLESQHGLEYPEEPNASTEDLDDVVPPKPAAEVPETLLSSELPINPARVSQESGLRSSVDINEPKSKLDNIETNDSELQARTTADLEVQDSEMRAAQAEAEKLRQEEINVYMERIDALQRKLDYLAKETVAAAREANAESASGSLEKRMAEKDEQIALLMQEGEKLSKNEMRHLTTMRKLNAKVKADEKDLAEYASKASRLEQSETDLQQRLRRSEQAEKYIAERLKKLPKVESDLSHSKKEAEISRSTIDSLRMQLAQAETRAQEAEEAAQKTAAQVDSKKVTDLQEELEGNKIERKLADERAAAELRRAKEEIERQKETLRSKELELRAEVQNLETRMETLRARAEEASSDSGGDSQAKLLRQIETLQTQYSLAAENWRTIEGSLNARVTAVEKEREEANKREADVRRKARDVGSKSRKLEDELESALEQSRTLTSELSDQRSEIKKLTTKLEASEKTFDEARSDFDRQRRIWEAETIQLVEESKARQVQSGLGSNRTQSNAGTYRSTHQPPIRKTPSRLFSGDSLQSLTADRATARRPSNIPPNIGISNGTPTRSHPMTPELHHSPSISRHESITSFPQVTTPSIDIMLDPSDEGSTSPRQAVNDVISASTVHTGPSVQLVERMSASIRKLEAEKVAHRDEMSRLQSQRDEARDEVVRLMRDAEGEKGGLERNGVLEKELVEVRKRYEACLEMVGEREEEVGELRDDVRELKRVYRELAETMGR